jgi:multidrug efflux pump
LRRAVTVIATYGVLCAAMAFVMWRLPGSFLPTEDQGSVMVQFTLPAGATAPRTDAVASKVTDWFLTNEKANTDAIFTVTGFSFSGAGRTPGWPSSR